MAFRPTQATAVNKNDRDPSGLVFDEQAVRSVLDAASLSLAEPSASADFQSRLNDIAAEYYWNELSPPSRTQGDTPFEFDAVADASVTPSRLKNRLIAIKRAAKRVQAAKSRHPLSARVAELLDRLGYGKEGKPKRYSGTETTGHGGSERSAVWLCLVRAVSSLERPQQGYRPTLGERPWASQRLQAAINSLAAFLHSPEENRTAALDAASAFHSWAEWSTARLKPLITSDPARHMGHRSARRRDPRACRTLPENLRQKAFAFPPHRSGRSGHPERLAAFSSSDPATDPGA